MRLCFACEASSCRKFCRDTHHEVPGRQHYHHHCDRQRNVRHFRWPLAGGCCSASCSSRIAAARCPTIPGRPHRLPAPAESHSWRRRRRWSTGQQQRHNNECGDTGDFPHATTASGTGTHRCPIAGGVTALRFAVSPAGAAAPAESDAGAGRATAVEDDSAAGVHHSGESVRESESGLYESAARQ